MRISRGLSGIGKRGETRSRRAGSARRRDGLEHEGHAIDLGGLIGVNVHREHGEPASVLEISPLFATSAAQLKTRALPFTEIKSGQRIYFDESGAKFL